MNRQFLIITLVLGAVLLGSVQPAAGAESQSSVHRPAAEYRHSIDFSPMSPLFRIYALQYNYHLSAKDELIFGAAYTNIRWDIGSTNAASLILGYRRFIWGNLHLEYQLWPDYDWYYDKTQDKYYPGFDLWNEFRLGYRFDFTLFDQPWYINIQWPFGFGLYAQNKPESFKQQEEEEPFFYFPPMFFVGFKF